MCACAQQHAYKFTGGNTLVGGISSYLLTHGNYSRATQQALANAALQRQLQASSAQQAAAELQAASSIVTPVLNRKQRLVCWRLYTREHTNGADNSPQWQSVVEARAAGV